MAVSEMTRFPGIEKQQPGRKEKKRKENAQGGREETNMCKIYVISNKQNYQSALLKYHEGESLSLKGFNNHYLLPLISNKYLSKTC